MTIPSSASPGRDFPIQAKHGSQPHPMRIPWSVAEKAYSVYTARYGRGQSLERIAERGGFYAEEMDLFMPNWRDEAGEIKQLRAALTLADRRVVQLEQELKEALTR